MAACVHGWSPLGACGICSSPSTVDSDHAPRPADEEEAYPHQQFVNDLLENAPESWDGEDAAESIAVAYVRALEERVVQLGGTTERWPDDDATVVSSWRWLSSTHDLQQNTYGQNLPKHGEALADYVLMNVAALLVEIGEASSEVGWKPWALPRGWLNREAFIGELVDAGHFLANMLVAVGCTDNEWETRYREKQTRNIQRQRDGYDGVSLKCHSCRRALDDVGIGQRESPRRPGTFLFVCGGCGAVQDTNAVLGVSSPDVVAVTVVEAAAECPVCHSKLDAVSTAFRAPELICDGTAQGCKMPDLTA